jgi:hypothetical protein
LSIYRHEKCDLAIIFLIDTEKLRKEDIAIILKIWPWYSDLYGGCHMPAAATEEITFKYKQVEEAIASLHNIPASAMKTFKGRIKHFQRIGLVPSSPGKGQRIEYRAIDAVRWALCFEFAELGVQPEHIKGIISFCGWALFESFKGPVQQVDEIFLLRGDFIEKHLSGDAVKDFTGQFGMFGTVPISEAVNFIEKEKFTRAIMVNMTHIKRELGAALDIDWPDQNLWVAEGDARWERSKDGAAELGLDLSEFDAPPRK